MPPPSTSTTDRGEQKSKQEAHVAQSARGNPARHTNGEPMLAIHRLEEVEEPVDPRISSGSRPETVELGEGYVRQLGPRRYHHHPPDDSGDDEKSEKTKEAPSEETDPKHEALYVEFEHGDARDPVNWPRHRKWIITVTACYFTALSGEYRCRVLLFDY
jgi:hypothetical protein